MKGKPIKHAQVEGNAVVGDSVLNCSVCDEDLDDVVCTGCGRSFSDGDELFCEDDGENHFCLECSGK